MTYTLTEKFSKKKKKVYIYNMPELKENKTRLEILRYVISICNM